MTNETRQKCIEEGVACAQECETCATQCCAPVGGEMADCLGGMPLFSVPGVMEGWVGGLGWIIRWAVGVRP